MQHCSGSLYGAHSVHFGHSLHRTDMATGDSLPLETVCQTHHKCVPKTCVIFMIGRNNHDSFNPKRTMWILYFAQYNVRFPGAIAYYHCPSSLSCFESSCFLHSDPNDHINQPIFMPMPV